MKTIRIFGIEFKYSLRRVKRLTISIPDNANDCGVGAVRSGIPCITYWIGCGIYHISLPKCKEAKAILVSRRYNKDRTDYAKNRIIVVDLYK